MRLSYQVTQIARSRVRIFKLEKCSRDYALTPSHITSLLGFSPIFHYENFQSHSKAEQQVNIHILTT